MPPACWATSTGSRCTTAGSPTAPTGLARLLGGEQFAQVMGAAQRVGHLFGTCAFKMRSTPHGASASRRKHSRRRPLDYEGQGSQAANHSLLWRRRKLANLRAVWLIKRSGAGEVAVGDLGPQAVLGIYEVGHPGAPSRVGCAECSFTPMVKRLRDQLPLRRFDLGSWAQVDERLAVRRLAAKHELRDFGRELLGLVGGNRPAPLQGAVAVVADLAQPRYKGTAAAPPPRCSGRRCWCSRRMAMNSLPNPGDTCFGIWEPEKMGMPFVAQKGNPWALGCDDVAATRAELEAKGMPSASTAAPPTPTPA